MIDTETPYRVATNAERLAHKYDGPIPGAVTTPSGRVELPVLPDDFPATMDEARERNAAQGHHWFTAETMTYFGTRLLGSYLPGGFFVTSEFTGWDRSGRAYTVRRAMPDGSVDSIAPADADEGETGFLHYPTARQAHAAAKRASDAYRAKVAE